MRKLLALLALAPWLALAQTTVSVTPSDSIQSGCVLNSVGSTCVLPMRGKTSASFIVTATNTPVTTSIIAEESRDGTNYTAVGFVDDSEGDCVTNLSTPLSTVGTQRSIAIGAGVRFVRVKMVTRASGDVTVAVVGTDTEPKSCPMPDAGHTTQAVSTATTLTQLVANPSASCSIAGSPYACCTGSGTGTCSIYVSSVIASSSVASSTAADSHFTFKYGTGTNCGTGTTTLLPLAMNVANGGFVWSLPPGAYIKVPASNALCWIHSVAGSKIINVSYFISF